MYRSHAIGRNPTVATKAFSLHKKILAEVEGNYNLSLHKDLVPFLTPPNSRVKGQSAQKWIANARAC